MKRLLTLLSAAMLLGGCQSQTIQPLPCEILSAGMLVDTRAMPLTWRLELRNYELLESKVSNDFYPLNLGCAKKVDCLVSKLYRTDCGPCPKFIDFVEMPRACPYNAPYVSPDGKHVLYERPDVTPGEGEYPKAYPRDRRTYRVTIYDMRTDRKYPLECYTEVYGLSQASFWRGDSAAAAFTTTCTNCKPFTRMLVVVDACGMVTMDASRMPDLACLEFISWSPRGNKLAALRPAQPQQGGVGGGTLVLVDLDKQTVTDVANIPPAMACAFPYHFEQIVRWDWSGNLCLRK